MTKKTAEECKMSALHLHGLIYAIDHILTEVDESDRELQSAAVSMVMIARDLSRKLSDDMDTVVWEANQ